MTLDSYQWKSKPFFWKYKYIKLHGKFYVNTDTSPGKLWEEIIEAGT